MGFVRLTISMDAQFLEKMKARIQNLAINRSEYLRGLVLKDLEGCKNEKPVD
ncbi:MAG TPA: hypothetical protein VJ343_02690 [archaeon]|nr:hypothetical protein [archaeon]